MQTTTRPLQQQTGVALLATCLLTLISGVASAADSAIESFQINPDCPLGTIRCDFPIPVRPELVEGLVFTRLVVRQAHHERPNGLSGIKEEETQLAKKFAVREMAESPFEYALSAGYRKDDLRWSIANGAVNIASEVDFKETVIAQLRVLAKLNLGDNWLVRGAYTTGAVRSGSNRDSDYAGSNRTQEFSRSENKTGGAVRDLSIGLGRKFRLFDSEAKGGMSITPLAGLSIHQQSLTMHDGQQTIPAHGAFPGLSNSYDAQWQGAWLGIDALLGLGDGLSLISTIEYHRIDYSAEANWNLRNDLAHPLSFKHIATGQGLLISVGASYRFSRNFLVNAALERQKWDTDAGYDQTHFSYGAVNNYTLNPVIWNSKTFSLAAVYQF